MMRKTGAWLSVALLAGCGSAPKNQYFMLSTVPAERSVSTTALPFTSPQADVHLPGLLDRAQVVVRAGQHRVDILETDRWGEPLDQMVSRVLNDDLQSRWATTASLRSTPASEMKVFVEVDQFIADRSGEAVLVGRWSIRRSRDSYASSAWSTPFAFSRPLSSVNGSDIAAAMSELLGRLADQIAGQQGQFS